MAEIYVSNETKNPELLRMSVNTIHSSRHSSSCYFLFPELQCANEKYKHRIYSQLSGGGLELSCLCFTVISGISKNQELERKDLLC